MKKDLTYSQALEAVKNGKRISRLGWNGKGMFVFKRPEDTLPANIIGVVKSLPINVKRFLVEQDRPIKFTAYLCMWSAQGEISNGWNASQVDMLADDWCILDDLN